MNERTTIMQKEYHSNYHQHKKKPCPMCGKPMSPKAKTCQKCMGKLYSQRMQGSGSQFWKGGRHIKTGYVMIWIGDDKYIAEHRVVWERNHNKILPKGWHIHHLNGIRGDNRLINLVALPSRKHCLVLAAKAKRIQQLEALLNGQHQLL